MGGHATSQVRPHVYEAGYKAARTPTTAAIRCSLLRLRVRQARHRTAKPVIVIATCATSILPHSSHRVTLLFATVTNDGLPTPFMKFPLSRSPDKFLLALLVFPVLYSPVVTPLSCQLRPSHRLSLVRMFVLSSFPPRRCRGGGGYCPKLYDTGGSRGNVDEDCLT
jgi:hypothetical protein